MARILGKILRSAAEVAVPAAFEKQKADIQAKRDAMMQQYQMAQQKDAQAFTAGQNQLTMEQRDRENQQQVALQAGQLGVANANLDLNRQQTAAQIDEINNRIKNANIDAKAKQELSEDWKGVSDLIAGGADEPTVRKAYETVAAKYGTYAPRETKLPTFEHFVQKDAAGDETTIMGFADAENQTFTPLSGSTGGSNLITSASGDQFDEAGIQSAAAKAKGNPQLESEFRMELGNELADKYFGTTAAQPATNAAPSSIVSRFVGGSDSVTPRLPAGGGVTKNNAAPVAATAPAAAINAEDPLAGFEPIRQGVNPLAEAGRAIGRQAYQTREAAAQVNTDRAVKAVVSALASRDLAKVAAVGNDIIQIAIDSGKLTDKQVRQLKTYIENQ